MSAKLLLGLIACGICAAPASARVIVFGSNLKADATIIEAHRTDTAFWFTKLASGGKIRAPATGQIVSIRLKGSIVRKPGSPKPVDQVFFQHLRPRGHGRMKVLQTSSMMFIPIGGDPNAITTLRPQNLCASKGDVIDFNDTGGATSAYPLGTPFQVFGRVSGSSVAHHTGGGTTNNGAVFGPTKTSSNEELLMQLRLGTGKNESGACRGFNAANKP